MGQDMFLAGMFSSQQFMFLEVKVKPCVTPNDPSLKWNPVCAPKEEVDLITVQDGFHGMNIYHSNYALNPESSTSPFIPYINDKLYFTFVPDKMTTLCDIEFQDITLQNDNSLLPFSQNEKYSFLSQGNNDIQQTIQLSRTDGVYVILTLRLSPYISVINRSFKKVSQLMSELGGFIQIIFACIGFVVVRYNSFKFIVDLANNLYTFDKQQDKKQFQGKESENKNNNKTNSTNNKNTKYADKSENIQQLDVFTSKHSLKQPDNSKVSNNNNLICPCNFSEFKEPSQKTINDFSQNIKCDSPLRKIKLKSQPKHRSSLDFSPRTLPALQNTNITAAPNPTLNTNNLIFSSPNGCLEKTKSLSKFFDSSVMNNRDVKSPEASPQRKESIFNSNIAAPFGSVVLADNCFSDISSSFDNKPCIRMKKAVEQITSKHPNYIAYMKSEKDRQIELENFKNLENQGKKSYLIAQFNKIILSNTKLRIGIKYFLSKLTLFKLFNSETNQYIKKATEMIHTDLDICNILDKIQQIDKLKNIVFDRNQRILFNFHQKPKISLKQQPDQNDQPALELQAVQKRLKQLASNKLPSSFVQNPNNRKGVLSSIINWDTVDSFKILYNSYLTVQDSHDLGSGNLSMNINKKLIRCLGDEVLSVFELSEQAGNGKPEEPLFFAQDQQIETFQTIPGSQKLIPPSLFTQKKRPHHQQYLHHQQQQLFATTINELNSGKEIENLQIRKIKTIEEFGGRSSTAKKNLTTIKNDCTWQQEQNDECPQKEELSPSLQNGNDDIDDCSIDCCEGNFDEENKKVEFSNYQSCSELGNTLKDNYFDIPSEQASNCFSKNRISMIRFDFNNNNNNSNLFNNVISSPHTKIAQFKTKPRPISFPKIPRTQSQQSTKPFLE